MAGYPWQTGQVLTATDLNQAIAEGIAQGQWNVGTVSSLGAHMSLSQGVLDAIVPTAQWQAGTVTSLGPNMLLSGGQLDVPAQQWNAGNVSSLGNGLKLLGGVLSSTGGAAVSDTPPPTPSLGQGWWCSLDGILYIWTGAAWAQTAAAGAAGPPGPAGPPGTTSFSGLTGKATYAQLPNEVQSLPLGFVIVGKPAAAQVYNLMTAMAITVPSGLVGSVAYAGTAPAASAAFSVSKVSGGSSTSLGTVTIGTSGSVSLAGAGGSLASGDVLRLTSPAVADSAMSDIGITVLTQRV